MLICQQTKFQVLISPFSRLSPILNLVNNQSLISVSTRNCTLIILPNFIFLRQVVQTPSCDGRSNLFWWKSTHLFQTKVTKSLVNLLFTWFYSFKQCLCSLFSQSMFLFKHTSPLVGFHSLQTALSRQTAGLSRRPWHFGSRTTPPAVPHIARWSKGLMQPCLEGPQKH